MSPVVRCGSAVLAVLAVALLWSAVARAATFTVTSDTDVAHGNCGATCTIRDAILAANASAGVDTIVFSVPVFVYPVTPLPPITGPVTIDGTTVPGYVGTPLAAVDGLSSLLPCLTLQAAGITVKAMEVRNCRASIQISAPGGDVIQHVRLDADPLNGQQDGIVLVDSSNNQIGGTGAGEGNTVDGNYDRGIVSLGSASGNHIEGNVVKHVIDGMWIEGSANVVGGTAAGAGNLVGGNSGRGIIITGGKKATGNIVQGNTVGDIQQGSLSLMNQLSGIVVSAPGTLVGGPTPAARNYLGWNGVQMAHDEAGIWITSTGNTIQGNYVGTDVNGTAESGNRQAGIWDVGGKNTIAGNVSSGNVFGIVVHASADLIKDNFVGVDATGANALPNLSHGIEVHGSATVITGNVSSASVDGWGMSADGIKNTITGNRIGTNAAGTVAMGNAAGGLSANGQFLIGGTTPATRNVIAASGGPGIAASGGAGTIQGNYIGTNAAGDAAFGNSGYGIVLYRGAHSIHIGGAAPGAGNLVAASGKSGILLQDNATTYANLIAGNRVGTNATGSAALGNAEAGIEIQGASKTTVGGTAPGAGNLISGNHSAGLFLWALATGTQVIGNRIGTNAAGTAAIPNEGGVGLDNAPGNTIGGSTVAAANLISGNTDTGIWIDAASTIIGNLIGTQADGSSPLGNGEFGIKISNYSGSPLAVGGVKKGAGNVIGWNASGGIGVASGVVPFGFANSFFGNGLLAIDNFVDGPTANDPGDADTGPDGMQNYPTLGTAVAGAKGITVTGTLDSAVGSYTIYFYASPATDVPAQGRTRLGSTVAKVPLGGGPATFIFTGKGLLPAGTQITAVAVGHDGPSEMSAPVTL